MPDARLAIVEIDEVAAVAAEAVPDATDSTPGGFVVCLVKKDKIPFATAA